jgi:hypothetical protein
VDHLVALRRIAEECHNNKTNIKCCFVDFRKHFDIVPRTNLWNRLEEIKVPFEFRVVAVRLYENVIAKFRSTKGWSEEINCNIGVNHGCPLSTNLFGIYIDKLVDFLEDVGCVRPTFDSIVIILILYANDIVLMARSMYDLGKQPRILKDLCSSTRINVNTDKMNVMIMKYKKI